MGVSDKGAEFPDGDLRFFVAVHKGVMGVPEEGGVGMVNLRKDLFEDGRGNKVAVRFDDDGDIVGLGIDGELTHAGGDTADTFILRAFEFVAVDADVRGIEFFGEVNEALGVGKAFATFVRICMVHFGGTAEVGDFEPVRGDSFLGGGDLVEGKFGAIGEVEVAEDAANFNGGEAVGRGESRICANGHLGQPSVEKARGGQLLPSPSLDRACSQNTCLPTMRCCQVFGSRFSFIEFFLLLPCTRQPFWFLPGKTPPMDVLYKFCSGFQAAGSLSCDVQ
jgi:hypothetical protein